MTKEEIFEKVQNLICNKIIRGDKQLDPSAVKPESRFIEDLGADSLDVLEFLMAVEELFDIDEIPEEDIEGIRTVDDAVNYLVKTLT